MIGQLKAMTLTRRLRDRCLALAQFMLLACLAGQAYAAEIAFSFDDAPRGDTQHFNGPERAQALLAGLAAGGVDGAIFFCIGGNVDEEGRERLLAYQAAGHFIANHSQAHRHPAELGLQGWIADFRQADAVLSELPGFLPLYRFPYLDEGRDLAMRDGLRAALAAQGYRNGYVTMDNYDWYMDSLLQKALAAGRTVDYARLGKVYVSVVADAADFYESLAQRVLGRSPRHMLLLHENDLAALYIADLAAELRRRGWTIIPGPLAYEDPIAEQTPDTLFNGQGRIAALAEVQGVPRPDLVNVAEDEAWLEARFEAEGVFGPVPE